MPTFLPPVKAAPLFSFSLALLALLFLLPSPLQAYTCIDYERQLPARGYDEVSGSSSDYQLNNNHPERDTDNGAPRFTELIKGSKYPTISHIYRVKTYPSCDHPDRWEDINVIGFASSGDEVRLPPSNYRISGCYQAIILYADDNTITLKYTREDDIVSGYTLYIDNIQVDSRLLNLYRQANAEGRQRLPAVAGCEKLGISQNPLTIAIRDTGRFMDPRWRADWWDRPVSGECDPGSCDPQLIDPDTAPPGDGDYGECKAGSLSDAVFRPYPYAACPLTPDPRFLDLGFASTFAAKQVIRVHINSFSQCNDQVATAKVDWNGNVIVHMEQPHLPFAGWGYADTVPKAETKYLADYFDGTLFYNSHENNRSPYDPSNPEDFRRAFAEAGVFRKIAPQDKQDELRCDMVKRAKHSATNQTKNPVHNYLIEMVTDPLHGYEESQYLANFSCPPDKAGTPAYENWRKDTVSGRLWPAVPLTTRDDYPGQVFLSVQSPPGYLENPGPHETSVPHMARLQEISSLVQNAVLSQYAPHELASADSASLVADQPSSKLLTPSSKFQVPSSKPLLASTQKPSAPVPTCSLPTANNQLLTTLPAGSSAVAQAKAEASAKAGLSTEALAKADNQFTLRSPKPSRKGEGGQPTTNKLLAQGTPSTPGACGALEILATPNADGSISFSYRETLPGPCYLGDVHLTITYYINGTPDGSCTEFRGEISNVDDRPPYSFACQPPRVPGARITAEVSYNGRVLSSGGWCDSSQQIGGCSCYTQIVNGVLQTTCGILSPTPPPIPPCDNPNFFDPPDRDEDALEDQINAGKLDNFSPRPVETILTVNGYIVQMDIEEYRRWVCCVNREHSCDKLPQSEKRSCCRADCRCCDEWEEFTVSRRIGTDVYFPYMKRTWDQIANRDENGLFQVFTPVAMENFEEKYAKDHISFEFTHPIDDRVMRSWTDPSSGWVYFPYLGGTQLSKECIVNRILCPAGFNCQPASCPPLSP